MTRGNDLDIDGSPVVQELAGCSDVPLLFRWTGQQLHGAVLGFWTPADGPCRGGRLLCQRPSTKVQAAANDTLIDPFDAGRVLPSRPSSTAQRSSPVSGRCFFLRLIQDRLRRGAVPLLGQLPVCRLCCGAALLGPGRHKGIQRAGGLVSGTLAAGWNLPAVFAV